MAIERPESAPLLHSSAVISCRKQGLKACLCEGQARFGRLDVVVVVRTNKYVTENYAENLKRRRNSRKHSSDEKNSLLWALPPLMPE